MNGVHHLPTVLRFILKRCAILSKYGGIVIKHSHYVMYYLFSLKDKTVFNLRDLIKRSTYLLKTISQNFDLVDIAMVDFID